MINLIKNEIYKIFHKKSIYVILIITALFILLNNVLYKVISSTSFGFYEQNIESIKSEIKEIDKDEQKELYSEYKTEIDNYELKQKYKKDSWQQTVIDMDISEIVSQMNYYTYVQKDNDLYNFYNKEFQEKKKLLDQDNWKKYAINQKNKLEEKLNSDNISTEEKNIINIDLKKINLRLEKDISYKDNYLNNAIEYYDYNLPTLKEYLEIQKKDLKGNYNERMAKEEYKAKIIENEKYKYAIENQIDMNDTNTLRYSLMNTLSENGMFILIIIIMVSGSIVSTEFNKGTIKLLLIKPYKRSKILLSKFITSLFMILFALVFVYITNFIIAGIMYGFNTLNIPVIVYNFKESAVNNISLFKYIFNNVVATLPQLVLLMTLGFSISTILNNSTVGVLIPILGFIGGGIINALVENTNKFLIRFLVTVNWDFNQFLYGATPLFKGITPLFSILICIIYFIVMIIPTIIIFNKRNIKNI